MTVNRLILGDNLEILKSMESDTIDLIYLDPPFFSNYKDAFKFEKWIVHQ
jgi:DNA modification methylase